VKSTNRPAANDPASGPPDIAEQMVGHLRMSDTLGPLAYDKQVGNRFLGGGLQPSAAPVSECHGPGDRQGGARHGGTGPNERPLAILQRQPPPAR